jgi:hypothetical protein
MAAFDGDGRAWAAGHAVDHALRGNGWSVEARLRFDLACQPRAAENGDERRLCRREEQLRRFISLSSVTPHYVERFTHRNPMWLVVVSIICGYRAAGR